MFCKDDGVAPDAPVNEGLSLGGTWHLPLDIWRGMRVVPALFVILCGRTMWRSQRTVHELAELLVDNHARDAP